MKKYYIFILFFVVLLSGCINENSLKEDSNEKNTTSIEEGLSICSNLQERLDCENVQDQYKKNDCYAETDDCYYKIARDEKDASICDRIPEDRDRKDWCLIGVAMAKKDISICDNVLTIKDVCYSRLAEIKKDILICDKIKYLITKDYCYKNIAIAKKDLLICNKVQTQTYKDQCYHFIISNKKTEDPSLCDKIQDETYKDKCYEDFAEAKKDTSLCNKIQNPSHKERCYNYVIVLSEGIMPFENFTVRFIYDSTSSGATRLSESRVSFKEGKCVGNCDASEGTPKIYSNIEDLIMAIQSGEIRPIEKGCHYKTCYGIIED
ncbi:MAG: hypothetical protein KAU95_01940 [Candidatus Aenigmarchaeota archaeon]|nr:hypothetical protein [Candidatus Aenigmarchaeota archaeon]